eukprot:scaffold35763_cov57-Phaeocystis_antarctica.AAC.3
MMPMTRCSLLSEIGISRRPASRAAAWLGLGPPARAARRRSRAWLRPWAAAAPEWSTAVKSEALVALPRSEVRVKLHAGAAPRRIAGRWSRLVLAPRGAPLEGRGRRGGGRGGEGREKLGAERAGRRPRLGLLLQQVRHVTLGGRCEQLRECLLLGLA